VRMVECVVVGGGPAGIAAATTAGAAGVETWLVDENEQLGGQYYRRLPPQFGVHPAKKEPRSALQVAELIKRARDAGVSFKVGTSVWGIFNGKEVHLASCGATEAIRAKTLVLAPGAHDRVPPFPGWTLPGVVTAGGAQNLLKGSGVLPGGRVLVAGSGPLLLQTASMLVEAGAHVVGLCEAASLGGAWRQGLTLVQHPGLLQEALGYMWILRRARVPIWKGTIVTRATGSTQVEGVEVTRCDPLWQPINGTQRSLEIDALVVGYGFVPAIELSRLAGCDHWYDAVADTWVPVRGPNLECSVEGVFVAGDAGGVLGAKAATLQGCLAGIAVATRLGRGPTALHERMSSLIQRRLRKLEALGRGLSAIYARGEGHYSLAEPDTIVCRCEEVALRDIRASALEGNVTLNELRARLRVGMGQCQGRLCATSIAHVLRLTCGIRPELAGFYTARPPVRPISLASLVASMPAGAVAMRGDRQAEGSTPLGL